MRRALVYFVLAGCVDVAPQFQCQLGDDSACIDANGSHGRCETSGNCSFPDPSCGDQGFRYDASAQPERVGVCVLSPATPSSTQPQLIGPTHTLAFEITTPPQALVFDTGAPGTDTMSLSLHWFLGSCPSPNAESAMPQGCASPTTKRILVDVGASGTYCLVVADDASLPQAHVALRTFPGGAAPTCLQ